MANPCSYVTLQSSWLSVSIIVRMILNLIHQYLDLFCFSSSRQSRVIFRRLFYFKKILKSTFSRILDFNKNLNISPMFWCYTSFNNSSDCYLWKYESMESCKMNERFFLTLYGYMPMTRQGFQSSTNHLLI